jgi:hypothetical protein
MRYMLLIYGPQKSATSEDRAYCKETTQSIGRDLAVEGKLVCSSPLEPVATASTVRVRKGEHLITAGPFAETSEVLGGFFLLDVANAAEAVAVAERLPPAKNGTVEVRPVRDVPEVPADKIKSGDVDAPLRITPDRLPGSRHGSAAAVLKKFMILCYHEEAFWADAGEAAYGSALGEAIGLCRRLDGEGKYLSASPLLPSNTAKSVRVRGDRPVVTDGPFAETREVLGGYYLILAQDQAEALAVAAQTPGARDGSCEVRELFDVN